MTQLETFRWTGDMSAVYLSSHLMIAGGRQLSPWRPCNDKCVRKQMDGQLQT